MVVGHFARMERGFVCGRGLIVGCRLAFASKVRHTPWPPSLTSHIPPQDMLAGTATWQSGFQPVAVQMMVMVVGSLCLCARVGRCPPAAAFGHRRCPRWQCACTRCVLVWVRVCVCAHVYIYISLLTYICIHVCVAAAAVGANP